MADLGGKGKLCERLLHALSWVHGVFNDKGHLATPKDTVWLVLNGLMENSMSPKYIYQVLKEDRWKVATSLKATLGIVERQQEDTDDTASSQSHLSDEEEEGLTPRSSRVVKPKTDFLVNIPPDKWTALQPVETTYKRKDRGTGVRNVLKLPTHQWTGEFAELIWLQHKLPCPFSFNNPAVTKNPDLSRYYISFSLVCNECGNEGKAYIMNKPAHGVTVPVTVRVADTRGMRHEKKRVCNGAARVKTKAAIMDTSAAVHRRNEARRLMSKPGEQEPPVLFDSSVLRKAKQEARETALSLPNTNKVFVSLEDMKYSDEFIGTIHKIGIDPVEIRYDTPGQNLVNNSLKKQGYLRVCIDATASLVARMSRKIGISGHIFLYELVADATIGTVQLTQLLSESQDAVTIGSWLSDWLRRGALCPNEAVCDQSPALLSALSRAFARCTDTKTYKSLCFRSLIEQDGPSLPCCYLRLDVNHLIAGACKWDVWKLIPNKLVKKHFITWLGLLVKSEKVSDFRNLLLDILTVARAQQCGTLDDTEGSSNVGSPDELVPAQLAINRLLSQVKGDQDGIIERGEGCNDDTDDPVLDCSSSEDHPLEIKKWVEDISDEAEELAAVAGNQINGYNSSKVASHFEELALTFVLWSGVMVRKFRSPFLTATSAKVEGDFNDLKNRILKNDQRPMKLNKFVGVHLRSILGKNLIDSAKVVQETSTQERLADEESGEELDEDEGVRDIQHHENWRGKASNAQESSRKSRKGYLDDHPEYEQIEDPSKKQEPKKVLLRNGSLAGYYLTSPNIQVMVRNTSAFDAVVQVLAAGFHSYPFMKTNIQSNCAFSAPVQVVKELATKGAEKSTYQERVTALTEHATLVSSKEIRNTTRAATKLNSSVRILEYNLEDCPLMQVLDIHESLSKLVEKVFAYIPSVVYQLKCANEHVSCSSETLVHAEAKMFLRSAEQMGRFRLPEKAKSCREPGCQMVPRREITYKDQLLVDITSETPEKIKLQDLNSDFHLAERHYFLVGLVAHAERHFYAICRRRGTEHWDLMDGFKKKVVSVKTSEMCAIDILVYAAVC